MAQSRLDKEFALDRSSRITDVWMNRLLTILETRIGGIEGKAADFDEAAASLVTLGLARINEALIPAIDRLRDLTELGFLIAPSSSEIEIELGVPTIWVIPPGSQRDFFAPSPFVIAVRDGDYQDYAVVQTISYDEEHGEFVGIPITVAGDPGPHTDWTLGALAGSTLAQLGLVGDAEEARDIAVDAGADALESAIDAAASRDAVEADKNTVQTLATAYSIGWWGARNTPPPLVGAGAAIVGSQYLDTSGSPAVVRVWNGSSWAPTVTIALGGIRRQDWDAVAGPDIQGPYAVGGGFTTGDVFLNGQMLDDSAVVFTPGDSGSFTISAPAVVAGDKVNFRGYMSNASVDSYTKAEADGRYLKLSDTGGQGRTVAAAATLSQAQDAVGMSSYGKTLVAFASAALMLSNAGFSSYVQTNIIGKADAAAIRAELSVQPTNNPAFTGAPTVPTAAPGTNNTQAASTAFVAAALNALVASAPGALDTLNELAAALGNDPNFATTMLTTLNAGAQINAAAADATLDDADLLGARRASDGVYIKQSWAEHKTQLAGTFAALAGTAPFTANQTISKANPDLWLSKTASGQIARIVGATAGVARWVAEFGDSTAEAANAGSDFALHRYTDAGAFVDTVLKITRAAAVVSGSALATLSQALQSTRGKLIEAGMINDAGQPVNLGATLSGNLTITMTSMYNGYGTATGNIVFNTLSSPQWRGGVLEITASGADRTVGFNTAAFCTPNNASLGTIIAGQTVLFAFRRLQMGKTLITRVGTVS